MWDAANTAVADDERRYLNRTFATRLPYVILAVCCLGLLVGLFLFHSRYPVLAGLRTFNLRSAILGRPQDIPLLVSAGRDPNSFPDGGMSPLEFAVRFRRYESAAMLLQCGADPNRHAEGFPSPLSFTCQFMHAPDNVRMARLLLDHGADPNWLDQYGSSPLAHACNWRQTPMVELLLSRGADPNQANAKGETPLFRAVWCGPEVIQQFLDHGADPLARDNAGRYAFEHPAATRILLEAAARQGRLPLEKPGQVGTDDWQQYQALAAEARGDREQGT